MMTITDIFVQILRLWPGLLPFSLAILNFCFLRLWNCRARAEHYVSMDWPIYDQIELGKRIIIQKPLMKSDIIFLPLLHIKLGLFKQFV